MQNDRNDLISRQAAIGIERNATVDTNPSHFEAHQKFMKFMDDAEISSFGRWQWSNGFNTALTAIGIDLKKLPSAQPEQKKGKWEYHSNPNIRGGMNPEDAYCSVCGFHIYTPEVDDFDDYNFCPNCGADMREDNNETD